MSVPRARAGWCRLACRLGGSRGTHRCARAVVRHAQTIGVCVGVSYLQMPTLSALVGRLQPDLLRRWTTLGHMN